MTIQESSPINPIPERGAPSNAHLGELLAADETVRALRYQQLIGIARDEGLTSGPHRPYKLTSTTEAQCLVYRALFSVPTPIPGSAGKTGPTSGTTVDDRGCVCVKVRAKDATIGVLIEAVTIDGTSTTFGASVLAGASTTTGAYETFDVLSSGITEGVLYPSGVSAGDTIAITVYAYHDNTSGSSEGYVAGIMVEECGITDTTIEPPAPPADVPTATALADFPTIADGTTDGESIIITETGAVYLWSTTVGAWIPPEFHAAGPTKVGVFTGSQDLVVDDSWVTYTTGSGSVSLASGEYTIGCGATAGSYAGLVSPTIHATGSTPPVGTAVYVRARIKVTAIGSTAPQGFRFVMGTHRDDSPVLTAYNNTATMYCLPYAGTTTLGGLSQVQYRTSGSDDNGHEYGNNVYTYIETTMVVTNLGGALNFVHDGAANLTRPLTNSAVMPANTVGVRANIGVSQNQNGEMMMDELVVVSATLSQFS